MINDIISYEQGELSNEKTLMMFSELIKTGQAWTLQGHYGRTAKSLIGNNLIDEKGIINWDNYNLLIEEGR